MFDENGSQQSSVCKFHQRGYCKNGDHWKTTTTTIFSKKEFVETEIVVKDIQEVVNISALMVNASSQDVFMHTSNAKLKMKLLY